MGGGGREVYKEGVNFAERQASCIEDAIARYRQQLDDEINKGEGRNRGFTLKRRATLHFWTVAEGLVPELFKLVKRPPPIVNNKYRFEETVWGRRLNKAALEAYDLACPHGTARQLRAYVLGRSLLTGLLDADVGRQDQEEEKEEVVQ